MGYRAQIAVLSGARSVIQMAPLRGGDIRFSEAGTLFEPVPIGRRERYEAAAGGPGNRGTVSIGYGPPMALDMAIGEMDIGRAIVIGSR